MKIEYLRYFIKVSEELNFTKAARSEHIAQTAMSKYIASLEKELGVRLFERNNRNVQLTGVGRQFYVDVQNVLKHYNKAVHNLQLMMDGTQGTLKIGVGIFEHVFVSQLLQEFHERYPQIKVLVFQYPYSILWEKALKGNFDIIFPYPFFKYIVKDSGFQLKPLFRFRYCVLLNEKNPLAEKTVITAQDFANQCVLTLSENSGPTDLKRFWLNSNNVGVKPKKLVQVNTLNSLFSMLKADYGIGFAPDFMQSFLPTGVVLRNQDAYPEDDYFTLIPEKNTNPTLAYFWQLMLSNSKFWDRYDASKYCNN